jgi:peroxiredoxin
MKLPHRVSAIAVFGLLFSLLPAAEAARQSPPPQRRYLIKPLHVGASIEVRARSVRSLQVRVTDENDRPVSDLPVLFTLAEGGGQGGAGTIAGGLQRRATTDAQGVATAEFQAGALAGASAVVKAQVEGTSYFWQGVIKVVAPEVNGQPPKDSPAQPPSPPPSAPGNAAVPQPPASELIGRLPKDSLARKQFTTNHGGKASLEAMRGHVVVMHFFGSWCGASKAQARALKQLTQNGLPPGLEMLGMSVKDPRSNAELVKQFVAEQQVSYPVVEQVDDKFFSQLVNSRDVSVPQTLIFGPDGKIIAHYNGYSPQVNQDISAIVKQALGLK